MDQKGCSDIAQQLCGFFCHCLVQMMDDLVTCAFLILVCIMCAHQRGCVRLRNDSAWCVHARVNHLCCRMFGKDLAKPELQMGRGKL